MNRTIRRLAAGAAVVAASVGTTTAAFAATGSTTPTTADPSAWEKVHHHVTDALKDRQKTLAALTSSVQANKYLTSGDRQDLLGRLGSETAGINQLAQTVEEATPQNTTIAQLRQDAEQMVHQFRVYLVMAPQVHLTEAADTQTDIELKIAGREPKLQAAIAKAGNPSDAVQAYNDLLTQMSNAAAATGKANIPAVLTVTPAGYPADGAPLSNARQTLGAAAQDLKAARTDLQIIRNAISQGKAKTKPAKA